MPTHISTITIAGTMSTVTESMTSPCLIILVIGTRHDRFSRQQGKRRHRATPSGVGLPGQRHAALPHVP